MKTKTNLVNGQTDQDLKYLALIDDYLQRMKELRTDLKRRKLAIDRLKASSRRRLAQIDTLLKAC